MISHSVRVGKTNSAPLIDRAVMPATLWPYFSSLSLLHVDKEVFIWGPISSKIVSQFTGDEGAVALLVDDGVDTLGEVWVTLAIDVH